MATDNDSEVTVVGAFENLTQAEQAIKELRDAGIQEDQIGFAVRKRENVVKDNVANTEAEVISDTAGGAISGGVLGGIIGAVVALLIPGLGPALAGGILAATLGGIVVGAAAGGIVGALTGMGVSEEEAQYYQQAFEAGKTIVTVKVNDRLQNPQEVRAILLHYGSDDISVRTTSSTSTPTVDSQVEERTNNSGMPTAPSTPEQQTADSDEMRHPGNQ